MLAISVAHSLCVAFHCGASVRLCYQRAHLQRHERKDRRLIIPDAFHTASGCHDLGVLGLDYGKQLAYRG